MSTSSDKSNNFSERNDFRASLASMVRPMRIELSSTAQGWKINISSLTPSDAMMALTLDECMEESTILSNASSPQWVARVDGSIGVGAANELACEVSTLQSPLGADFRMQAIVMSQGDGMCAHVRTYKHALLLGAHALAQYMWDVLREPVSLPDLGLVDNLLDRTGRISIRQIETEIYSTFVDVGICTLDSTRSDMTLIYDIHSDSWHSD